MLLFAVALAHAGCEKDTDCKGDRICDAGACTEPSGVAVAPPQLVWASHGQVLRDGAPLPLSAVEDDLRTNPRATYLLNKGRTERTLGIGLMAGGLGLVAGGVAVATTQRCFTILDDQVCMSNAPYGAVMIAAGLGAGLGGGLPLFGAANRNERRAVEAYTSVSLRYTGDGAAVAWSGAW
jgi:hypothetical protein